MTSSRPMTLSRAPTRWSISGSYLTTTPLGLRMTTLTRPQFGWSHVWTRRPRGSIVPSINCSTTGSPSANLLWWVDIAKVSPDSSNRVCHDLATEGGPNDKVASPYNDVVAERMPQMNDFFIVELERELAPVRGLAARRWVNEWIVHPRQRQRAIRRRWRRQRLLPRVE